MACTARGCDSCASRAAEVVSASHSMCVLMVQVASRLTVSQWPITRAPQKHFDVLQARVAMWEHVRRWRGSHACSVRDERALYARGRVQGAARRARAWRWRGRGSGEARCAHRNREIGKSGNRETHGAHTGTAMRPRIFSTLSSCSRRKDKASAASRPASCTWSSRSWTRYILHSIATRSDVCTLVYGRLACWWVLTDRGRTGHNLESDLFSPPGGF